MLHLHPPACVRLLRYERCLEHFLVRRVDGEHAQVPERTQRNHERVGEAEGHDDAPSCMDGLLQHLV